MPAYLHASSVLIAHLSHAVRLLLQLHVLIIQLRHPMRIRHRVPVRTILSDHVHIVPAHHSTGLSIELRFYVCFCQVLTSLRSKAL